jgi:Virulence factor
MAKLVTIYWRDIPAQVNAQSGRIREQVILPGRFQDAIDKAIVAAELFTYHESVKHWRRTDRACGDDLEVEAAAEAERVTTAYTPLRLDGLVANFGFEP